LNGFEIDFKGDVPSSGRGASQMLKNDGKIRTVIKAIANNSEEVFKNLSPGEQTYLQTPWQWGCASTFKIAGPEFACLGSVKINKSGERKVVCIPFLTALALFKATNSNPIVTLAQVIQFIQSATETELAHALDNAEVLVGTVSAWEALKLPAGWLVAEEATNNVECFGWRGVDIDAVVSPNFSALLDILMPMNFKDIKANSTNAMLHKITMAI